MPLTLSLALLKVMDKEPGITAFWVSAVVWGALGYLLARRRRWWAVPILGLLALSFAAVWSEWSDPFVGPAIVVEAGRLYPYHLIASTLLAAGLTIVGMVRRREQPNER